MHRKTIIIIIVVLVISLTLFYGCNCNEKTSGADSFRREKSALEGYDYLVVADGKGTPYWKQFQKGVSQVAEDRDVKVLYKTFRNDKDRIQFLKKVAEDRDSLKGISISLPNPNDPGIISSVINLGVPLSIFRYGYQTVNNSTLSNCIGYVGQVEEETTKNLAKVAQKNLGSTDVYLFINKKSNDTEMIRNRIKLLKRYFNVVGEKDMSKKSIKKFFSLPFSSSNKSTLILVNCQEKNDNTGFFLDELAKTSLYERKFNVISYDVTDSVLIGLSDGIVDFVVDQQAFLQGYNSVLMLDIFNKKREYPNNYFDVEGVPIRVLQTGNLLQCQNKYKSVMCRYDFV
jgi:hypothetical protein